jgi:hypothetical protein
MTGSKISCEARLAMTLRVLAGGQIHDVVFNYGLSRGEATNSYGNATNTYGLSSICRVVDTINGCQHEDLKIEFLRHDAEKLIIQDAVS